MIEPEDLWWIIAVVALLGLWVLEVALPVAIAKPVFSVGNRYADGDTIEEGADIPRPVPLGPRGPITGAVLSFLFLGMTIWRYFVSRAERRWMWMTVAAAITCTWALTVIVIAQRAAHHLTGG